MSLANQLSSLLEEVRQSLAHGIPAATLRADVLGRKGRLSLLLRALGSLSAEERAATGSHANHIKKELEELLGRDEPANSHEPSVDPTVPAANRRYGSQHPVSLMIDELVGIFRDLSFEVAEGNELVTEKENFDTLNMGPDHPARDGHDTFYVTNDLLLRTQMTAVQVLEMSRRTKEERVPIRVVVPGRTYRRESDQTHSPMFHQIDAVMVDSQTTFTDLRGILDYMCKRLFGDRVETRFRPHFFPFTEPSAELDIRWKLSGTGESGKHTEWLEMGGCGMIHPAVLKRAGINPKTHQGWAFGMAIERPIMVRHQIPDLRRLFENPVHLLDQFSHRV